MSGQTIASAAFNSVIDDLYQILNTERPVAYGGTGADTAAGARVNLGLVIGTNVQAYSAALTAVASAFTAASASGPASLALAEDTDNGTSKVSLTATASLSADRTATFPDKSGTVLLDADIASSANFLANTADKVIDTDGVWSAAAPVSQGASLSGNLTLDFSTFVNAYGTATGNITFNAFSNLKYQSGIIEITASGGDRTVGFNTSVACTPNNVSLGTITSGTTVAFSYARVNSGKVMFVRLGTI